LLPTGALMTVQSWLTLIACAGLLGLAVIALARGGKSPLALPLALLCICFFSWNLAQLAYEVSGEIQWRRVDTALSPLTGPFALLFAVIFVGRWRELRLVVIASFAVFGALGATSLLAFVSPGFASFAGSTAWALVHLAGVVPLIATMAYLLWRHLRTTYDPEEQIRTRLVIAAVAIGGALATTELFADLGTGIPRGGNLGALATAAVMSIVALRLKLLEAVSAKPIAYAGAFGVLAVVAYLGAFYLLRPAMAMLVLGTVTVTLVLAAGMRQVKSALTQQRERLERMALLGRFSAQLAHDLKNPLAALKGAAQFLEEERRQGRSLDEHAEFLGLIAAQVERIGEVIERYERIGRLEPEIRPVAINDTVRSVLALSRFAASDSVKLVADLATDLPECPADEQLVARAIENLLRNAFEAMPAGGRVEVSTRLDAGAPRGPRVVVRVGDGGPGMDVRTAERAFDDFYTTKTHGSGLGLAFVKRVAEAHGGEAVLSTRLGRGTEVALRLPAA
jgi:two-component system, NtrC family, sensor histidine kinase HydH